MRLKLLLLALPFAVACGDLLGSKACDEYRSVETQADFGGSGADKLGSISFQLAQRRDSTVPSSAVFQAFGPSASVAGPLRGHIAKLRVLTGAGAELLSPRVDAVPPANSGNALFNAVANFNSVLVIEDLRARMLAGDIRLELTTDESPARVFTVMPRVTTVTDWQKVYCL